MQPRMQQRLQLAALLAYMAAAASVSSSTGSLTVEVFANSVMRGAPKCTLTLQNGFNISMASACSKSARLTGTPAQGDVSLRVTGTLAASGAAMAWREFGLTVGDSTWVRLWVDDHRLVDEWSSGGRTAGGPVVTPGLLPNVSMSSARPVSIRVDLRPWAATAALNLAWRTSKQQPMAPVPPSALSPAVSAAQAARRKLQERAATGWNQWARHSQLSQIVLPQQLGIDLSFLDGGSGLSYTKALVVPIHNAKPGKDHHVRMGMHAFDGSYSLISAVPFPLGTPNCSAASSLNFTVQSATKGKDNFVLVTSNASSEAEAAAANVSVVVNANIFWGAAAMFSMSTDGPSSSPVSYVFDAGELGQVTVAFSQPPRTLPSSTCCAKTSWTPRHAKCAMLEFAVGATPLAISLSFSGRQTPSVSATAALVAAANANARAEIVAGGKKVGGGTMTEAYDAMATAIAWNVNFDPRVAVTCPVSRTFESGFDFIFFDWDMYFLSLMAGTLPAAANSAAFDIAISNLIETTQTRSAYGQVMNKRAASGSSTSDTNDRSEPYVGSMVTHRIWQDAQGTERAATLAWVVDLLFPSLLGWNQWCLKRRYNVGKPGGGLIVLGNDNNLPCEGSTVGLNSSRQHCAAPAAGILESGMDNSPMYYNAFPDPTGKIPNGIPAAYDNITNRVQLYDCQQSSLFVSESLSLQALAKATASAPPNVGAMLKKQSDEMSAAINSVLWDASSSIYRQVDASPLQRGFSAPISPTSFYPMLGGVASSAQAEAMVKNHLTNSSEFCVDAGPEFAAEGAVTCPFALPSISRSDPNFYDNSYWRGRTWGPLNLLTWISLSHPKYAAMPRVAAARKGLCKQSVALLLQEWRERRHVHENYNSTSGEGCDVGNSNPFYHWGSNLGYIAMREALAK